MIVWYRLFWGGIINIGLLLVYVCLDLIDSCFFGMDCVGCLCYELCLRISLLLSVCVCLYLVDLLRFWVWVLWLRGLVCVWFWVFTFVNAVAFVWLDIAFCYWLFVAFIWICFFVFTITWFGFFVAFIVCLMTLDLLC